MRTGRRTRGTCEVCNRAESIVVMEENVRITMRENQDLWARAPMSWRHVVEAGVEWVATKFQERLRYRRRIYWHIRMSRYCYVFHLWRANRTEFVREALMKPPPLTEDPESIEV